MQDLESKRKKIALVSQNPDAVVQIPSSHLVCYHTVTLTPTFPPPIAKGTTEVAEERTFPTELFQLHPF